jgi:acetyltransferase-like isoleucine patch superfamily enzyme
MHHLGATCLYEEGLTMHSSWLVGIRNAIYHLSIPLRRGYFNFFWGMKIGKGTRIARSAKLDKTNPSGILIGEYSTVAFGAVIIAHDFVNNQFLPVKIGSYCFIGARSIIMPGLTIGDHCIIGAGAVVVRDVPAGSVVVGNPGRVVEQGINTGRWGVRVVPSVWSAARN